MFDRVARFVIRHRRLVIAGWLVAAVAVIPFTPKLGDVTNSDEASFLPHSYESSRAGRIADKAFPGQSGASAVMVFKRTDGKPLTPDDRRVATKAARDVGGAGIDRVAAVRAGTPEQLSPDGRVQLARVGFQGDAGDDAVMDAVALVEQDASRLVAGTGLEVGLTGDAVIKLDDRDAHDTAEKTVGAATIGLIFLLLLAIFRSPVAALLPILSIAVVFGLASSLIAVVADGLGFDVSLDLPPLLTVVLFGIGADYILFTLFRYREQLRSGTRDPEAITVAAGRVGEVITFAAFVVMVAFSALGLSKLGSLQTMAPGLVIGVALMWLAGLTLVPAVISLAGPRIFWPSRSWRAHPPTAGYRWIGRLVASHPARMGLASGGLLVVLAAGALFYTADYDSIDQLPGDAGARKAFEQMRTSFPAGSITPTQVLVTGDRPLDRKRIARLAVEHRKPEGVAAVKPPTYSRDGRSARIDVILKDNPYSNEALDTVEGPLRNAAHSSGAGQEVLVGGQTSMNVDLRAATNADYALVFPVAALAILVLLGWLLRSAVAPFFLLASVMLGFAATLGFTVAAFQGLFGQAGLKSTLPIILYLFVVAVGTDYSILMTARLREEAVEGHPPREATALGVEHGGPAVAAAGIILAGTFTSLLLTGIASLMQIGFAVSSGILIASFVMATLLVPSLTTLLGRVAWWPGNRHRKGARPASGPLVPKPSERAPGGSDE